MAENCILRRVEEAPHFITFDKLIPKKKSDCITSLFKSYNKMKVGNDMHIKT